MIKCVAFFYSCLLNDGKYIICNEALVQTLYVGTKKGY
jgi:hypothetical protein